MPKTFSSSGAVYFETRDGKHVVSKTIRVEEYNTLVLLKGLPGIVPILELQHKGDVYTVVMEKAEFDGIKAISNPNFKFRSFVQETSRAVATLHKLKLVHNDLKLENFLQMKDGHYVLTDFGPTRKIGQTLDIKYTDPRFKAPWLHEKNGVKIKEIQVQPQMDIYTLGLMYGTVYLGVRKYIKIEIPHVLLGLAEPSPENIAMLRLLYPKKFEDVDRRIENSLKKRPDDKELHEIAKDRNRRNRMILRTIRREYSASYQKAVAFELEIYAKQGDAHAKLFFDMIQNPETHKIPNIEDIVKHFT